LLSVDARVKGASVRVLPCRDITKFQVDRSGISAIPRFYEVIPTSYGKDHISGDGDLVAVPDAIVVGSLL
jgi:hypothetical protein